VIGSLVRVVGFALLIFAVVVGAWWAWCSWQVAKTPASSVAVPSESPPAVVGLSLLEEAEAIDRLAAEPTPSISRDPFAPPPSAPRAPSRAAARFAIPKVVLFVEGGPEPQVVLTFGRGDSPPLGAGDLFEEWRIVALDAKKVLVEHEGIHYTLPVP